MTTSNVRIDVHIWEVNCKIFSKQDLCSFFFFFLFSNFMAKVGKMEKLWKSGIQRSEVG